MCVCPFHLLHLAPFTSNGSYDATWTTTSKFISISFQTLGFPSVVSSMLEIDRDVGPCEWMGLWSHGHSTIWLMTLGICRNPSLGLATKARVCKVQAKTELGSHISCPRSAKECEGMNPNTPKWTLILGVGVPMDFQIFKGRFQGSKFIRLKSSLYHWKAFGT